MPKPTDYDKTHLRNMAAIGTRIDRLFKKAAEEAAKIGVSIKSPLPEDRIFSFDDYPQTQKQIERLLEALRQSTEMTIADGVRREWRLSNAKNNSMVTDLFGERVKQMTDQQKNRYFTDNADALEAFLQRKTKGLNLSDRVWKYTDAFKTEIEMGLDLGIRSGRDAAAMSRDLREYLQHPDKLFRRVRDKHGLLRLSQAAKDYHPGQGVYRSSYKNARRLAATETNIAYRTNDYLRWQQMDFVVGIEIQLSNNHTILLQPGERTDDKSQQRADGSPKANAVRPLTDICDTLQGRYPKDFKFTGWHPHCRCRAITILKTEEEMAKDTERILAGKQPTKDSVNTVRDVPDAFKQWVEKNTTRIENARNLPYFIADNKKRVDGILGKVVAKTPAEAAAERHAKRDPEAIQRAWNERRIANIQQAIDSGLLPKEVMAGLSALSQEQLNERLAFLQQRGKTHAERDPKEVQKLKEAWQKRVKEHERIKRNADRVLALAKTWREVDYSALEKLIAEGKLTGLDAETRKVMDALKAMRAEEKALADLIPDVHGWHKMFTLDELKEAHGSIQSTLDFWKTKYGADLATDSNLAKLQSELEQKIKFVENPGAFKKGAVAKKYWQVTQDAYIKQLDQVESRIAIIKLTPEYENLLMFKTTSKDFKFYMEKAKAALDAGDAPTAQHFISVATSKKNSLEASRKGKSKSKTTTGGFDASEFTQAKKDAAHWFGGNLTYSERHYGWNDADEYMTKYAQANWAKWSAEEREVAYLYTSGSRYINEPLFSTYYGSKHGLNGKVRNSWKDINTLTDMIENAVPLKEAMWVQHGEDMGAFMGKFGIDLRGLTPKQLNALVGTEGINKPFTSCGCAKYSGFADYEVVMNIYCPAGTKGIYTEPFSHYGDNGYGRDGYNWKGQSRQKQGYDSSYENEIVLQRGAKFKITKIQFNTSEHKWYVDVELIEQPKKEHNVI